MVIGNHKPEVSDSDLISVLRAGSKEVFELIFSKYHTMLRYIARCYLHDEYLVDEVIADVFVMIWQKREDIEINSS